MEERSTDTRVRGEVRGPEFPGSGEIKNEILTREALGFVLELETRFGARRRELLDRRREVQARLDAGKHVLDFLPETRDLRQSSWRIAAVPSQIQDRRVEITGPVDRKMIINALNSGAKVFMADFEDSHSPTWQGTLEGQVNLRDAIRRTISFKSPEGKEYRLNDETATLFVRPRGWHLEEKHVLLDGRPVSGSLFDFGIYFFNNARELLARGTRPYFYLPKMESHLEARLWNDVFVFAQEKLGIPQGTIKATVLIETILAAFEMDEILYELRNHSAGLNCGRWDYIFSFIKKLHARSNLLLPDRAQVTMTTHFLKSYSELLIQTCHRRGAHAMGGMAAQIPIKNDPVANDAALAKVRADKEREAKAGHDGTWVAHPGLVPIAREVFDRWMPGPNQLDKLREDVHVEVSDLLVSPTGAITTAGLQTNVSVALRYMEAWLRGQGCVPIDNLMEDAATAEISRAQLWQWIRHPDGKTEDGAKITAQRVSELLRAAEKRYPGEKTASAREILERIVTEDRFTEFLTLPAYGELR